MEEMITEQMPEMGRLIREKDDVEAVADEMTNRGDQEMTWSLTFDPHFIDRLFESGFLPIACNLGGEKDDLFVLLPKLHEKRSVCDLKKIRVKKSVLKQSKEFEIRFNTEFNRVAGAILNQHTHCWLYPPLLGALKELSRQPTGSFKSKVISVELFDTKSGSLVAGELGVMVGAVYTSLTGFCDKERFSGSGNVQMAALAGVLADSGVYFWDLGMSLPYKADMGS